MTAPPPWVSTHRAQAILKYTQYSSPPTLLLVFLVAFVAHSVVTSPPNNDPKVQSLGPGGKPLPRNLSPSAKAKQIEQVADFSPARKAVFNWTSVGLVLTFLATAVLVIAHVLTDRSNNWWCGQAVVVSFSPYGLDDRTDMNTRFISWRLSSSTHSCSSPWLIQNLRHAYIMF